MDLEEFKQKWERMGARNCHVVGFFRRKDEQVDEVHFQVESENPPSSHPVIYNLKDKMMICDCEDFRHRGPCCIHLLASALFFALCNYPLNQFDFHAALLTELQAGLEPGIPNRLFKFSPMLWALGYGEGRGTSAEDMEALRQPDPLESGEASTPKEPEKSEEVPEEPEPIETLEKVITEVGDHLGHFAKVTFTAKRTLAHPLGGWLHVGTEELVLDLPTASLPLLNRVQRALLGDLSLLLESPEIKTLLQAPPRSPMPSTRREAPSPEPETQPEEEEGGDEEGQDYEGEREDVGQFWG